MLFIKPRSRITEIKKQEIVVRQMKILQLNPLFTIAYLQWMLRGCHRELVLCSLAQKRLAMMCCRSWNSGIEQKNRREHSDEAGYKQEHEHHHRFVVENTNRNGCRWIRNGRYMYTRECFWCRLTPGYVLIDMQGSNIMLGELLIYVFEDLLTVVTLKKRFILN